MSSRGPRAEGDYRVIILKARTPTGPRGHSLPGRVTRAAFAAVRSVCQRVLCCVCVSCTVTGGRGRGAQATSELACATGIWVRAHTGPRRTCLETFQYPKRPECASSQSHALASIVCRCQYLSLLLVRPHSRLFLGRLPVLPTLRIHAPVACALQLLRALGRQLARP